MKRAFNPATRGTSDVPGNSSIPSRKIMETSKLIAKAAAKHSVIKGHPWRTKARLSDEASLKRREFLATI